jgi:hypothetical protein
VKSEKQAWAASGYHVVDMSPEESDEEDGGAGRESVEVDEELESLAVAASSRFPNEWFGSANPTPELVGEREPWTSPSLWRFCLSSTGNVPDALRKTMKRVSNNLKMTGNVSVTCMWE